MDVARNEPDSRDLMPGTVVPLGRAGTAEYVLLWRAPGMPRLLRQKTFLGRAADEVLRRRGISGAETESVTDWTILGTAIDDQPYRIVPVYAVPLQAKPD